MSEPLTQDSDAGDGTLVSARDIRKVYGTGAAEVRALNGVTFSLGRGEFVSVCGPSGSGKSTLLTVLAGLNHPSDGEVVVDDIPIYGVLDNDGLASFRSEYIGFVFQSFQLLPYLSVIENVMLPLAPQSTSRKQKRERARGILRDLGLEEKTNRLPGELSGGQCQRVAIARALVNEPLLILADEPTGNLDSATRDEVLETLKGVQADGRTVVMVTHDPENVKAADRVLTIVDGELLTDGS